MDRTETALTLRKNHFNCAQAIVCAFANVIGYDPIQAYKMAEPFGMGMGCEEICGVLSGMAMVVGFGTSDGNMDQPLSSRRCYNIMRAINAEFKDKNGTNKCTRFCDPENNPAKLKCRERVALGCEILDRYLLGIYDDSDIRVIKKRPMGAD